MHEIFLCISKVAYQYGFVPRSADCCSFTRCDPEYRHGCTVFPQNVMAFAFVVTHRDQIDATALCPLQSPQRFGMNIHAIDWRKFNRFTLSDYRFYAGKLLLYRGCC